jgi:hypothetical protein
MGSSDPERDAAVLTQAVLGRMQEFLWRSVTPSPADVDHLFRFCSAAIGAPGPSRR